jgi:hypothetical protein
MGKIIPFCSARQINSVGDYHRFYHTKAYLAQRSALFKGSEANRGLMALCGYIRYEKFSRRRPEWDALARPVPLGYLSAIEAKLDVLAATREADMEEFHAALRLPLSPRHAIERVIPGFYTDVALPVGVSEADAVTLIRSKSRMTGHEFCLNFPGLKAVFVRPDGEVSRLYFPPTFTILGGFLMPGRGNGNIGTCRLG